MASVIINEVDNTASVAYSPTDTIVYIPGLPGNDVDTGVVELGVKLGEPKLYTNEEDFIKDIGSEPLHLSEVQDSEGLVHINYDKSYVMAKQLLKQGMYVLYEVVKYNNTYPKSESDMINALEDSAGILWSKLDDRALYNPRFITSGGYPAIRSTNSTIANNMVNLAHFRKADNDGNTVGRGDCIALVDHEQNLSSINEIYTTVKAFANTLSDGYGTYAATFTPWGKYNLNAYDIPESVICEDLIDGYWAMPGSFAYLLAFNAMNANNASWFAAAGVSRGAIPLLKEPMIELGAKACQSIQSRKTGEIGINPIYKVPSYDGYRIFGNRTLKMNDSGLKATSFLNIRNLISDIKKVCYQACLLEAFEQNTDILWANLRSNIEPTLEKMITGQGIRGYKINRQATSEKGKVVGKITIIPIEAVEDFELTVELTDSLEVETESE